MIQEDHLSQKVTTQRKPTVIKEEDESQSDGQQVIKQKSKRPEKYLEYVIRKEEQEIDGIGGSEDEDRMDSKYERTRGVASHRLQIVRDRDEDEEEEEDPDAYKYPQINKGNAATEIFDSEDDENDSSVDLESQKMKSKKSQQICYVGGGAVGKLKALKSSKASAFASNRVVYQNVPQFIRGDSSNFTMRPQRNEDDDEEDDYESDFENESYKQDDEDDTNQHQSYFIEFENKYNKSLGVPKQQKQGGQNNSFNFPDENPLMHNNKYFLMRQDLQKDINSICSDQKSKDEIVVNAFKFIKKLSTFIDLSTIDMSVQSGSTNFNQTTFPVRENRITGQSISRLPGQNSPALIPFKQRIYQYLVKLYDDSNWEDILGASSAIATSTKLPGSNQSTACKKQQTPTTTNEESKDEQPATGASTKSKNKKRKMKEKKQKQKDEQAKQQAKLEKQIIEIEMDDLSKNNKKSKEPVDQSSEDEDESGTKYGLPVDANVVSQILQEQHKIELVKEEMKREQRWRSQVLYDTIGGGSRDVFGSNGLPSASMISRGLKMSFPQEDEIDIKARNQKRHIEERTSLLTGMYQKDKYSEDFYSNIEESQVQKFDSIGALNDPTTVPNSTVFNPNEDVEMRDESREPSEVQKKKKRKNKKNKKKKGANLEEEQKDEAEIIELDDIQIGIDTTINGESNLILEQKKINDYLEIEPKLIFELTQEDKNFLEATRRLDEEIGEEIELFESTQLLTEEVASTLIQSCIESVNIEEQKITSTPVEILKLATPHENQPNVGGGKKPKKNKKNNNNTQQQQSQPKGQPQPAVTAIQGSQNKSQQQPSKQVSEAQVQQQPKNNKKMAKKAAYKAKKEAEKKQAEIAKQETIIEEIIIEEDVDEEQDQAHQEESKNKEVLQSDVKLDEKADDSAKFLQRKVVDFNVVKEPLITSRSAYRGYASSSAEDQDDIKVPKRGSSSRGSSCTEEKIHQDTISMLGDLFPQQYKNPSDNTKEMISKITSSSSGGSQIGSAVSSPENINNFSLNKRPNQKFIEQPYESTVIVNQNKKKNHNKPQQSSMVEQDNSTQLRIKPKAVKKEKQPQTQPVPPKSSSAQPVLPKQEFEGYDTLFKSEAFDNASSKGSTAKPQASTQQLTQDTIDVASAKLSDSKTQIIAPEEETKKPKNKKKASKDMNPPIVKEMKERGAIVRPADLEKAKKKQANSNNNNPVIPKSHTPGVGETQETMGVSKQGGKQKNNGVQQQHQNNSTGKTGNQKQVNNQSKKKNQSNINGQNNQEFPPHTAMPNTNNQQYNQVFAGQQNPQAAFLNPFGLLPQSQGNNFMINPIGNINPQFPFPFNPAQMPYGGQPNFNQFNPMMMGSQLSNQNLAANIFGGQNLFNQNDYLNPLDINAAQMERNSQQTQTDETRIKENGGTPQSPQVINQFQNINVQLHLPAQQHPGSQISNQPNPLVPGIMDFQQQLFQAQLFNQMLLQNQGHDPQMQVGGTPLQNMMGINPLFFNPMITQQTPNFPGSSPFLNPQAQFLAHQQLLQQQQQQFQQHTLNHQQSMFQQQQFIPQPISSQVGPPSNQPVKPYHRSPSYPTNTNHQKSSPQPYNNSNGNYQQAPSNNAHHLIQEILNQLSLQTNGITPMKQDDHPASNDPSSQSHMISHITQEKQEEIYQIQAKEEQFFFKLDQEIYKIQGKLKLKLAAIESERQIVLQKIEYLVKSTFKEHPEARIQMYGSMATGLAIDSSDMDLLISGVFCFDAQKIIGYQVPLYIERHLMIEQLQKLFKDLQKIKDGEETQDSSQNYINACSIIDTASVPVIKLVIDLQQIRDNEAQKLGFSSTNEIEPDMRYLKIDITFNDSIDQQQQMLLNFFNIAQTQHMGIQCCNFIVERLQMYPILESLTLVLKKFLAIRNLNSPFLGGLNSYGLIILIIAYLNESYQDYFGQDSQLSKSRALKGFLYFYGKQFDQSQFMINADQQIVPNQIFSSTLVIEDPLNPTNNIGKSTFNFDKIRTAFSNAHDQIEEMLRDFIDQAENEVCEGTTENGSGVVWKKKLDILSKILEFPSSASTSDDNQSYVQSQQQ